MLKLQKTFITAEEYFAIEEAAEYKSEYYHGEMFAMSGAFVNHNLIVTNVLGTLYNLLRNSDCFVFPSDIRVELDRARHYAYPDVSLVCGDIRCADGRKDTILNPVVIIEVLSESTQDYDKGLKFKAYQNIPSLKEYILIDQYSCSVEHFFKNEAGKWLSEKFDKPEDTLRLRSVDAELSLRAIYHRVKF